ncbi:MAG: hypothetical protein CM1200mP30_12910 [Pseudomonadota bacterium]|nr:MAG: hypothetical protein CM1200mP30_12910 [Pseudomonadota bacterium]
MKSNMFEIQSDAKSVKPNISRLILISLMIMFVSGCITLGKDFPEANVSSITNGVTTKNEIRRLFGPPWLSGFKGRAAGMDLWQL